MSLVRATLLRRSLQLAGLLDAGGAVDGDDAEMATDFLTTDLDALQEQGIVLQNVERTTLSLVASTAEYTLPDGTLNVVVGPDNIAGTIVSSAATESPVRAISRHEYTTGILNKTTTTTTPTHVYIEKTATLKAVFWPVPSDSTMVFRYERVVLNDTMDGFRRWQKWVMWNLAATMARAKSKPLAVVADLERKATAEKALASGADAEKPSPQFYVPRWWGR